MSAGHIGEKSGKSANYPSWRGKAYQRVQNEGKGKKNFQKSAVI